MHRSLTPLLALLCSIAPVSSCFAETEHRAFFVMMGSTTGGKFSGGIGFRGPRYGLELGGVDDAELQDDQVIQAEIPHSDFTDLGRLRIGPTAGADFLFYLNRGEHLSLFMGPGLYGTEKEHVVQSNVTGWIWRAGDKRESLTPSAEAGLHLFVGSSVMFGVAFHSLRGASGYLGATW